MALSITSSLGYKVTQLPQLAKYQGCFKFAARLQVVELNRFSSLLSKGSRPLKFYKFALLK